MLDAKNVAILLRITAACLSKKMVYFSLEVNESVVLQFVRCALLSLDQKKEFIAVLNMGQEGQLRLCLLHLLQMQTRNHHVPVKHLVMFNERPRS
jgi:hypothetical protein